MILTIPMSLYLQYRPQLLEDVVGQPHVVQILQAALEQKKLAHAYLFTGSRGTGKTSTARIIAKYIVTQHTTEEARKQMLMKGVEDGTLVDIIEIDGASNRNIDDIRNLKEQIQFAPVIADAKVYIIDEVHMFTKEAFNALLKTLEEPPNYAYFILATTEIHKIPVTIQSRCQTFLFKSIDAVAITERLRFIATKENIVITDDALKAIAEHANGGMRDAISLLDQLQTLDSVSIDDVYSRTGTTSAAVAQSIWSTLKTHNTESLGAILAELQNSTVPFDVLLQQILRIARQELHEACKNNVSTAWHEFVLQTILTALQQLRSSPVPLLPVELALLRILHGESVATSTPVKIETAKVSVNTPPSPVVKQPIAKQVEATQPVPVATEKQTTEVQTTQPEPVTVVTVSLENIQEIWPKIRDAVQPASAKMSLKNGIILRLEQNTIVIGFSSQFHLQKSSETSVLRNLEDALLQHFGQQLRIRCTEEYVESTNVVADTTLVDTAAAASEMFNA